MPVPQERKFTICGTGILHQQQARCLFHKKENSLFVEQAGKPVLENAAICEFIPIASE
ncbi:MULTISPECIES: hypothetical protein [unclassified Microcoleus]|uniref:hypothetical protein n=1 Tax=unclassified Microcoleus TaxID=2642155 RepID=UPI002FD5011D